MISMRRMPIKLWRGPRFWIQRDWELAAEIKTVLSILHVATHEGVYRGGAVQACRIANAQARAGHLVTLVVNAPLKTKRAKAAAHLATWRGRLDPLVRLRRLPLKSLLGRWALDILIRLGRYDVVHAHRDVALNCVARIARHNSRFAFIAQRGTTTRAPKRVRRIFRSLRLDAITAVAEAVVQSLLAQGAAASRIHMIYGIVDIDEFSPGPRDESLRARHGFAPEDYVIGSLSSYRKEKGLEAIVEAAAEARATNPRIKLLFLASDVEHALKESMDIEGDTIESRCAFAGHQSDIAPWIRAMDCTIIAATAREGLSGVLRESLACETPVISTDSDGNTEIVKDRETGLLVEAGNTASLRDAMLWAAAHPAEMTQFARAGRHWVADNCSDSRHVDCSVRAYRAAIARRATKPAPR
ncbi:N/A [soil metagenome]